MRYALREAEKAFSLGETPVGAVIVYQDQLIATGYNLRESSKDPTAHAEMFAIRSASQTRGGWRLFGCTLYVTLEPCAMCAGALVLARLDRLVYAATDPKAGAVDSIFHVTQEPRLNHQLEVSQGILQEDSSLLLSRFFRQLRQLRRDGRVVDCARLESE